MLIDGDWKGRTVFQLKTVPTRRYHSKAPVDSTATCLRKILNTTEVQSSTVTEPCAKPTRVTWSQHWSWKGTESESWWPFVTLRTLEFHKVLLELFETPETETGELENIRLLDSHSSCVDSFSSRTKKDTVCSRRNRGTTRLYLVRTSIDTCSMKTSTDQDGKSFVKINGTLDNKSRRWIHLDWTDFVSDFKLHPWHCCGTRNTWQSSKRHQGTA